METTYSYVSDPPLFADIGDAEFRLTGIDLSFNFQEDLRYGGEEGSTFNLTVEDLHLDFAERETFC